MSWHGASGKTTCSGWSMPGAPRCSNSPRSKTGCTKANGEGRGCCFCRPRPPSRPGPAAPRKWSATGRFCGSSTSRSAGSRSRTNRAATTIARLYDLKADPASADLFSFEEAGERYGLHWLRCRTRDDLGRRMRALKAIADATYGLIGRTPDHVAGLVTGLAMKPSVLED